MKVKDYFINEDHILAFSMPDLVTGIIEAQENGRTLGDPNLASKVGVEYRVALLKEESEIQKDSDEDTEDEKEEKQSTEDQDEESKDKTIKPLSEVTDEEIDAFDNFPDLKEFANKYGITGRGEIQVKKRLKEARDNQ